MKQPLRAITDTNVKLNQGVTFDINGKDASSHRRPAGTAQSNNGNPMSTFLLSPAKIDRLLVWRYILGFYFTGNLMALGALTLVVGTFAPGMVPLVLARVHQRRRASGRPPEPRLDPGQRHFRRRSRAVSLRILGAVQRNGRRSSAAVPGCRVAAGDGAGSWPSPGQGCTTMRRKSRVAGTPPRARSVRGRYQGSIWFR